jgi:hypothetical protein
MIDHIATFNIIVGYFIASTILDGVLVWEHWGHREASLAEENKAMLICSIAFVVWHRQ